MFRQNPSSKSPQQTSPLGVCYIFNRIIEQMFLFGGIPMATITKRGQSYQIRVSCGYDVDGKQIRRIRTWRPDAGMSERQIQKELDRQAVLFEEQCRTGQVLDGNIKLADFIDLWFDKHAATHLRPTTVAGYRKLVARTIAALGHIRVDKLQPQHLMAFYENLAEPGVRAPRTH